tara:strand:- start:220 stop:495 length:276 start_codon:yes stop_codon:yes gene_type:complete
MEIKSRNNVVTLEIDLSSAKSMQGAMEYIIKNKSSDVVDVENQWQVLTTKVRVIKALRAYGILVSSGELDTGLKSAKGFYERTIDQIVCKD